MCVCVCVYRYIYICIHYIYIDRYISGLPGGLGEAHGGGGVCGYIYPR